MKPIDYILPLVALMVSASSCQKVINVKLNSAAQRYVIQGEINDGPGPYRVTISRTKDFSGDNTFEQVSGAGVTISDSSTGSSETLQEITAGTYQTVAVTGVPGHTYTLVVSINGQEFSASSAMPSRAVFLDTLYAGHSPFNNDDIFITPVFTDPVGKGNYYLLRQWVNGNLIKGTAARSDDATDGQTYDFQLFYDTDDNAGNPQIHEGDSITAELQCVNRQVYDYFRTLQDVTGASNSAAPVNPITNLSGGALGIFNACTTRVRSGVADY